MFVRSPPPSPPGEGAEPQDDGEPPRRHPLPSDSPLESATVEGVDDENLGAFDLAGGISRLAIRGASTTPAPATPRIGTENVSSAYSPFESCEQTIAGMMITVKELKQRATLQGETLENLYRMFDDHKKETDRRNKEQEERERARDHRFEETMERLIAAQSRAPQVEPVVTRPPAVIPVTVPVNPNTAEVSNTFAPWTVPDPAPRPNYNFNFELSSRPRDTPMPTFSPSFNHPIDPSEALKGNRKRVPESWQMLLDGNPYPYQVALLSEWRRYKYKLKGNVCQPPLRTPSK
jgi:hypothetical protein